MTRTPPQPCRRRRASLLTMLLAPGLLVACASTPLPPEALPATPAAPLVAPVEVAVAAASANAASAADPLPTVAQAFPVPSAGAEPEVPVDLAAPAARGRLDPADDAARGDLWARVRDGFAMQDLDNELVRKWEQWYATRPDYVQRMTERGGRYLFHIVEEVQRRDMPVELALLPFIESAFNPQALSHARAAGMWQFMPLTGKDFELRQNLFRDDRRDVLASTRAALDYLQRLHEMFGDWHLALAAYNWGQGNVQRAVARNEKAGLATDYESLRMPDETRNYVPKLQAVKNIVLRPEAFALVLPGLENHPFFLTVPIERDIDVALAAQLAGLSVDEFQQLNPQMNKPVILAAGTPQVLLPYDNANIFLHQLARHRGPMASWTAWVAPKTLKPADAARHVGISEAQLREVNRIPARMLVKAGSTLLVPRGAKVERDVAEHVADNAMMLLAPEARPVRKAGTKAGKKGSVAAARPAAGKAVAKAPAKATTRTAATKAPARKTAAKPAAAPKVRVAQQNDRAG